MKHPFHTAPVVPGEAVAALRPRPRGIAIVAADAVDRCVALLCKGVLLLTGTVLMGVMSANVVARYVLSTGGFSWAEEVPEQVFPWFIMAGVVLAVQHGGHIAIEWLIGKLGRNVDRLILLAGHILVIGAYALLVKEVLAVAEIVAMEKSPTLGLPKSYGYFAIASGSVLIALSTAVVALRIAVGGPEALPRPRPEEIPT